jgi:hypothetical protein
LFSKSLGLRDRFVSPQNLGSKVLTGKIFQTKNLSRSSYGIIPAFAFHFAERFLQSRSFDLVRAGSSPQTTRLKDDNALECCEKNFAHSYENIDFKELALTGNAVILAKS